MDIDYEKEVKKIHKSAFLRKTVSTWNVYQVCIPKYLILHEGIGDTHFFKDQAWESAYNKIMKIEKENNGNW